MLRCAETELSKAFVTNETMERRNFGTMPNGRVGGYIGTRRVQYAVGTWRRQKGRNGAEQDCAEFNTRAWITEIPDFAR